MNILFIFDIPQLPTLVLVVILAIGLAMLCYGGDWLTLGSASVAILMKINPIVVGLTIVAAATSTPELITAFFSTASGNPGLAMGNIVGSNICNIGLILGISAIILPFTVHMRLIKSELPILLAVTILFSIFCIGNINRIEGLVMVIIVIGYLYFIITKSKTATVEEEKEFSSEIEKPLSSLSKSLVYILAGGLLLALGADFLVDSSVELAKRLGVSDILIGITVVAIGTSLPELAAAVSAARKKQSDLVAGNIVGSNLFNLLLIGGSVSTVYTMPVDLSLFYFEIPAMIFITMILWLFFYTGSKITKGEGIFLLVIYAGIILISSALQLGLF